MVRISLVYGSAGLLASGIIYSNLMRAPGAIDLLVDTEAAVTMISPSDQARLGIDPLELRLRRSERRISTVAGKGNAFKMPDCLLSLPSADRQGDWVDLEASTLYLLERSAIPVRKPLMGRPWSRPYDIQGGIPSLLGRDLLELHGLRLLVDFDVRSAHLETKDSVP